MKTVSQKEREGRKQCAAMLRELREWWENVDFSGVPDDLIGEALLQQDPAIMRRYLEAVKKAGPGCERGFLAGLSNFLGGELQQFPDECLARQLEGLRQ